ncbi:MAG: hypothetical protein WCG03_05520 [Kiritimatiellales bacterium]
MPSVYSVCEQMPCQAASAVLNRNGLEHGETIQSFKAFFTAPATGFDAAKRQLNADAELRSFCGEVKLGVLQRYQGELWAFALEGYRLAEGAK